MVEDTNPAIKLENLTKFYRRSHLGKVKVNLGVENLTLAIKKKELFGLLGPNGSGKTTAIKLILGLLFPTKGIVEIKGVSSLENRARQSIGYLPEVPYFYKYLTAYEVLRFYGRLSGMNATQLNRRIEEVLETVRMTEHAGRLMREFSRGMLQRIGLAQAILHDPEILIFDEPVGGLDPVGVREMRELMLSLNRSGKTIFFSSHSISEVEKICSRVAILVRGHLQKVIDQKEWSKGKLNLEEIFIETVTASGPLGVE